jgi:predicted amidophosphoribosyltransferase
VEIGPHHLCPSCLQRWPTEGAPPESCVQCGSPLVHERDLMSELGLSGSSADALNARMERHVRMVIAPGFEWSQVKGP